jgi:hypothetical protein
VQKSVEENPRITYADIEAETSLHPSTIQEILHVSLDSEKIAWSWVPHQLTNGQRAKLAECCREDLRLISEGKL